MIIKINKSIIPQEIIYHDLPFAGSISINIIDDISTSCDDNYLYIDIDMMNIREKYNIDTQSLGWERGPAYPVYERDYVTRDGDNCKEIRNHCNIENINFEGVDILRLEHACIKQEKDFNFKNVDFKNIRDLYIFSYYHNDLTDVDWKNINNLYLLCDNNKEFYISTFPSLPNSIKIDVITDIKEYINNEGQNRTYYDKSLGTIELKLIPRRYSCAKSARS